MQRAKPSSKRLSWRFAARVIFVFLGVFFVVACETRADARHLTELDSIVKDGATGQEAAKRLQLKFEVHEKGSPSWDSLEDFLRREPLSPLPGCVMLLRSTRASSITRTRGE